MNNETLTFLSSSKLGSWIVIPSPGTALRYYSTSWPVPAGRTFPSQFIPNDFVGLNTNINEPLTPSEHMLGFPQQVVNSYLDYNYKGGLIYALASTDSATSNPGDTNPLLGGTILNGLIHHRQGPYGWPTWKQIRGGQHPLARYWRKNNTIPITVGPYAATLDHWRKDPLLIPLNTQKVSYRNVSTQYIEPPVTSRFQPLKHGFIVSQDNKRVNLSLKHSYGNLISHYANQKLNISMGNVSYLPEGFEPIYDDLKAIYIEKKFTTGKYNAENPYGMQIPYKKWINFLYSETVFPKETNSYLAKTRFRLNYEEVAGLGPNGYDRRQYREFWRDSTTTGEIINGFQTAYNRNIRTPAISLNSENYTTFDIQSIWDLDTSTSDVPNTGRASTTDGERLYVGELESVLAMSSSCVLGTTTQWGWYQHTAAICLHRAPIWTVTASIYKDQLYRGVPVYSADQDSGLRPFFNSYEEFVEDIRGIAKSYSILPEFRISEHMDYYINEQGGDFRALNNNFLSLDGASVPSSSYASATASLNSSFFVDYSHSDFLKYFQFFKEDHNLIDSTPTAYTLTANAAMKLLPYNGFYPFQRAKQLGGLLSQSYGPHISGAYASNTVSGVDARPQTYKAIQTAGLNTLLRPFVSPGIAFNSLKSAIAVDYPVVTGSSNNQYASSSAWQVQPITSYWAAGRDARLPFEAVIEPHNYLPVFEQEFGNTPTATSRLLLWDEPDGININNYWLSLCYWNGEYSPLYSLAANNFFGEVPHFFLEDEKFTDFVSAPQDKWKAVDPNKTYYMDVILKKSKNMVLCEGSYETPPGYYSASANQRGIIYGPALSSSWSPTQDYLTNMKDPAYAAYTPPYFYEDSIARLAYTPTASGVPNLDDVLASLRPVITSTSAATAQNNHGASAISGTFFTGSSLFLGLNDAVSRNKMKITASVNLFGKARYKKVTYSTNIGPNGKYVPLSFADTSEKGFEAWNISTKFESPALNFSQSHHPDIYNASTGRGLWGGYANATHGIPTGSTGLFLQLKESFPSAVTEGQSQSTTGSLLKLCGFKTKRKRIGKLAESKTISEAIVAIPYAREGDLNWINEGTLDPHIAPTHQIPGIYTDQYVFSINSSEENIFQTTLNQLERGASSPKNRSKSVTRMIEMMRKYNIPPMFDFVQYPEDIKPFAMYILEFNHQLSKQDLSHIWQGLMPEISRTAKMASSSTQHPAGTREFFQGKQLPNYTRWMVFKVKQKSEKSYFNATSDQQDDKRFDFKFLNAPASATPAYNYNWPYDFFSLIELASLNPGVEFQPSVEPAEVTPLINVQSSTPINSDTEFVAGEEG